MDGKYQSVSSEHDKYQFAAFKLDPGSQKSGKLMGIITSFNTLILHTQAHFVQFSLIIISPGDVGDVAALQCPRGNVINEMMQATQTACNYLNLTGLRDALRESTSRAGKYGKRVLNSSPTLENQTHILSFTSPSSSLLLHAPSPVCKVKKRSLVPIPHSELQPTCGCSYSVTWEGTCLVNRHVGMMLPSCGEDVGNTL